MALSESISENFKTIVNAIDTTINGIFSIEDGCTYSSNTKWAQIGRIVRDSEDRQYKLTEVEQNVYIKAVAINHSNNLTGVIQLPSPLLLIGTKMSTNWEWTKKSSDLRTKLPLIWLLETYRYIEFGKGDSRDYEADVRVFFLDETNPKGFTSDDSRKKVVHPVSRLADNFITCVNANTHFKRVIQATKKDYSRFGIETDAGAIKNILDADLSGVELNFTLTAYKGTCKGECDAPKLPSDLIIDGGFADTNYLTNYDGGLA